MQSSLTVSWFLTMQVPALMHGQIVTWMDSKAMFGSERYHM